MTIHQQHAGCMSVEVSEAVQRVRNATSSSSVRANGRCFEDFKMLTYLMRTFSSTLIEDDLGGGGRWGATNLLLCMPVCLSMNIFDVSAVFLFCFLF